jgi:hypothetical protein
MVAIPATSETTDLMQLALMQLNLARHAAGVKDLFSEMAHTKTEHRNRILDQTPSSKRHLMSIWWKAKALSVTKLLSQAAVAEKFWMRLAIKLLFLFRKVRAPYSSLIGASDNFNVRMPPENPRTLPVNTEP